MIVTELWRYPVKSLGGERVDTVDVDEHGLHGDRRWGIRDNTTGLFLTARRVPELLLASATVAGSDAVVVHLPDGTETDSSARLSTWLGRDVSLVRAPDTEATYESPRDAENDANWYEWTGPGTALHDESFARVSVLSERTVGSWNVRRFRPNVLVAGGGEDSLVGRTVQIGTIELDIVDRIARCVMVTRPQPDFGRDLEVLKAINRDNGGRLSVGGLVRRPGSISLGDRIMQLDRPMADRAAT